MFKSNKANKKSHKHHGGSKDILNKYGQLNRTFISMDLGTTYTLIYVSGHGIIFNERSILAYNARTNEILAIGNDAFELIGKPMRGLRIIEPLQNGVINDLQSVSDLIYAPFRKLQLTELLDNCVMLLACPSRVTKLEMRALRDIAKRLGAANVFVEEEVKMAAIGSGIDITQIEGNLVVDIGGGTTDVAVLATGDIVVSKSVRVAGNFFTSEIVKFVKNKFGLAIGFGTAEKIKIHVVTTERMIDKKEMIAYGRDMATGLPREQLISSFDIEGVLDNALKSIMLCIRQVLEITPPELLIDVMRNGITLAGGGALLGGLDKYVSKLFDIPCHRGNEPLLAVLNGTIQYEEKISELIDMNEDYSELLMSSMATE